MNPTLSTAEAMFDRLLGESSALICARQCEVPDDDLHREILLPLLPAMLGDDAIRKHWQDQTATGFLARLRRHLDNGEAAPRWAADDFQIHVTASYTAGPDAKALADTLLSEESLRDMAASLMNQILDAAWTKLPLPAIEVVAAEEEAVAAPVAQTIPAVATPRPAPGLPPLPAAMLAHRLKRRALRTGRENPIAGARTWRGKIGEPDWSHSYPLAGCTAEP